MTHACSRRSPIAIWRVGRCRPESIAAYAEFDDLPLIRIDVGGDEVLLDDAIRYANRAPVADLEITLSAWETMPHVFRSSPGSFSRRSSP